MMYKVNFELREIGDIILDHDVGYTQKIKDLKCFQNATSTFTVLEQYAGNTLPAASNMYRDLEHANTDAYMKGFYAGLREGVARTIQDLKNILDGEEK